MKSDLVNAISDTITNKLTGIHTSTFGLVLEYDAETSTATIVPLATGLFCGLAANYPVLYDVPIVMPKIGDISITVPVKKNDVVLVMYSERSLKIWQENKEDLNGEVYSLNNAFALPGFAYGPTGFEAQAVAGDKVIIANGETSIELRSDKVIVNGDLVVTGSIN
jgi:hypothetical protein